MGCPQQACGVWLAGNRRLRRQGKVCARREQRDLPTGCPLRHESGVSIARQPHVPLVPPGLREACLVTPIAVPEAVAKDEIVGARRQPGGAVIKASRLFGHERPVHDRRRTRRIIADQLTPRAQRRRCSFAAGRVTHVAGLLEKLLPDESTLLYRALIAQSARWPEWAEQAAPDEKASHVRLLGYGLPDADRATSNSEYRVTCITQGNQSIRAGDAVIFAFYVPEELRRMGQEAAIRIDVSLSYSAEPRRTRSNGRRYLAVWLDWICSRPGETLEAFQGRVFSDVGRRRNDEGTEPDWTLSRRSEWGQIPGARRDGGTLQKDWTYLSSYELPEVIAVAVRGHEGWARHRPDAAAKFALAVSIEAVNRDLRVYEYVHAEVQARAAQVRIPATPSGAPESSRPAGS